jgi:hypothetical protein
VPATLEQKREPPVGGSEGAADCGSVRQSAADSGREWQSGGASSKFGRVRQPAAEYGRERMRADQDAAESSAACSCPQLL